MNDLVSRSKVLEIIHNHSCDTARIELGVLELPTVEAKPVVHGEWMKDQVETGDPYGNGLYLIDMLRCSVCGGFFDVSETRNFCPECGADMRGGKNEMR